MTTLFILQDADGCIYNHKYREIIARVIKKHARSIYKFQRHPDKYKSGYLSKKIFKTIDSLAIDKMNKDSCNHALRETRKMVDPDLKNQHVLHQYTQWLHEVDPEILDYILLRSNYLLLDSIVKHLRSDSSIDKIVFMVGSNRQSAKYDQVNSKIYSTRSFYYDLRKLAVITGKLLNERGMNHQVTVDEFLLADVFANKSGGSAYQLALSLPQGHADNYESLFDHDKISIIYAFSHYIADQYSGSKDHQVLFVDNNSRIHGAIGDIYDRHKSDILPASVSLLRWYYNGNTMSVLPMISGQAPADRYWRESVKLMVSLCGADPDRVASVIVRLATDLNVTNFLQGRLELQAAITLAGGQKQPYRAYSAPMSRLFAASAGMRKGAVVSLADVQEMPLNRLVTL